MGTRAYKVYALDFGVAAFLVGVAFLAAVAFLGVAFLVAVAFLGAAAFLAGALGAAGALVLVTRPDFVLPRTRDTASSTAGAGAVLRGLLALAFGLAAAAAAVAAAFLGAAVFFSLAFLVGAGLGFWVKVSNKRGAGRQHGYVRQRPLSWAQRPSSRPLASSPLPRQPRAWGPFWLA